ncbi:hypothetical protein D3C81_1296170 [compost metagenome]
MLFIAAETGFSHRVPGVISTFQYIISTDIIDIVWCFRRIHHQGHIKNVVVVKDVTIGAKRFHLVVAYIGIQLRKAVENFEGTIDPSTDFVPLGGDRHSFGVAFGKGGIDIGIFGTATDVCDLPMTEWIIVGNLIIPVGAMSQVFSEAIFDKFLCR